MTYDWEIFLIKNTYKDNEIGDSVKTPVKRDVLASILDYRNKDFYQAAVNGHKPSITFGINKYEYEEEQELEYDGRLYRIIDVYPIKVKNASEFESIALICSGLVNDNATT